MTKKKTVEKKESVYFLAMNKRHNVEWDTFPNMKICFEWMAGDFENEEVLDNDWFINNFIVFEVSGDRVRRIEYINLRSEVFLDSVVFEG